MNQPHPDPSRFDPLSRIITYDDFDHVLQGWTRLIGNYEHSLDSILPLFRDLRPPNVEQPLDVDHGYGGVDEWCLCVSHSRRANTDA